jgi:hypothetical protein
LKLERGPESSFKIVASFLRPIKGETGIGILLDDIKLAMIGID